ncbi:hypothetical protein WJU23_22690 [Prosthecobacter sp. SYSU 5D2]|uniref:hypothetical protein n=1 Tax=Prosthecobacter sp. SYSU 5D2 TaxID=3134134 RepID=UPI0031FE6872
MKSRLPYPASSKRGALMGVALLMMLCSGLFLASWVTIISTRAIQVSWLESAVQRRISLENSRLLSWQTAMNQGFDPETDLAAKSALLLGGNGGGIDTAGGWKDLGLYSVLGTDRVTPYNQTGLRPGGSYFLPLKFLRPSMPTGVALDPFTAHLLLKSHCPVLNGDLVVVYRKPDKYPDNEILDVHRTTAPYRVEGRVVVRHPPSLFARGSGAVTLPMQSKAVYIQSYDAAGSYPIRGTGLENEKLIPSNLSAVPSSSGPDSSTDGRLFDGYLNVINNEANPENSLMAMPLEKYDLLSVYDETKVISGCRLAEFYDTPDVPPPDYANGGYPVPFRTLYINVAGLKKHLFIDSRLGSIVNQIVIEGQNTVDQYEKAGQQSPVIVTFLQGTSQPLRNIAFKNENNRPLILGIQKFSSLNTNSLKFDKTEMIFTWTGDPLTGRELRWRMTLINEGQNIRLRLHDNSAYDITWIGGVMTNWTFIRDRNTGPRAERLTFKSDKAVPTKAETSPTYESLLPRDAWLETFFLPDPPPKDL